MKRKTKIISISIACVVAISAIFVYVFKTYEGILIQEGFKSQVQGTIQNNEFRFSVADPSLADELMKLSGSNVQLHYKEYFAPLPWRGTSCYVVDKIESVYNEHQ